MNDQTLREVAIRVSSYFRDFLETDFKRRSAPRRRIVLHSDAGLRCGMATIRYPRLDHRLWQLLDQPARQEAELSVSPREHTRSISPTLQAIITEQIQAISESTLQAFRTALGNEAISTAGNAQRDPESWVGAVQAFAESDFAARLVSPILDRLEAPLRRASADFADTLRNAEADLVRAALDPLTTRLAEACARHLAHPDPGAFETLLTDLLELESIRRAFRGVLDGLIAADAFLELREIDTHATVTEGQQIYLYLGALRFRGTAFPVLFTPVQVSRVEPGRAIVLRLTNVLFVNRSAIDFVLQELANERGREWSSPIRERIHYLRPEQSLLSHAQSLFDTVAIALGLLGGDPGPSAFAPGRSELRGAELTLSPALHLCAFERAEESAVNDYEEIVTAARLDDSRIVQLFAQLVGSVLKDNPPSIARAIDAQWAELPLGERLVFDSPIPLNEEQRKVLLALRHPEGPIIVVEGPPGTGKSHTITAIAADCAFNQRSCLILSDKSEALQVVQDKLSEAMSRVRHDASFPNPLLRLGRQDANFRKLVGNQTLQQVAAYVRASERNRPGLLAERDDTARALKDAIAGAVTVLGRIEIQQIERLHQREALLRERLPAALEAIQRSGDDEALLRAARRFLAARPESGDSGADGPADADPLADYLDELCPASASGSGPGIDALEAQAHLDERVAQVISAFGPERLSLLRRFSRLTIEQAREIQAIVLNYRQLRMPLFGYLFRGSAVRALEARLNAMPTNEPILLREQAGQLATIARSAIELHASLDTIGRASELERAWASLAGASGREAGARQLLLAIDCVRRVPGLAEQAAGQPASVWLLAIGYLADWLEVRTAFARAPQFDYVGTKTRIERLNTSLMNAEVDSRLVDFVERHRADARTMAQLMAQRQKFPVHKFDALRSSFPIIIAGIREFGEYMPLAPALFDVVVIDEASQVSVAQALPALLRARKVVCLGDSRQFSNVKSANASIALNDQYRSQLVQFFEREVTRDRESLERLAMFDVKRSVLEFCSLAASWTVMLRKHFRSYPELIGYSSSTFYGNQLQALRLRTVPIEEVIRFEAVDASGAQATRTTNPAEAEAIFARLETFLERAEPPTVGIVTPFREQRTLIQKRLLAHPRGQEFERRLRLKIMTFDTCQGEERSVIFYSLVASPGLDALNYVFPVSLAGNVEESVEEKLKVQRLNVGFSRAQDCIWIMHSQEIGEFKGALAQALHHYRGVLCGRPRAALATGTDPASPMEARVLAWLQQTRFVQAQPEGVEIIPQFPIGDYLRQLDPTYRHPPWRVDFLLACRIPRGRLNIVIEYDGFEYHFDRAQSGSAIHASNHGRYLNEHDVERQLTLEGYGYRFLRINRFNIGPDPVATLDLRLARLIELATGEQSGQFVERLRQQAQGIARRELRQCARCAEIRPVAEFWDPALKAGSGNHGRVCMRCKESG